MVVGGSEIRFELDGPLAALDCFGVIALGYQDIAKIGKRLSVGRRQFKRPAEATDGSVEVAPVFPQDAQLVMRSGQIGMALNGLLEAVNGAVQIPLCPQGLGQAGVRTGKVRVQLNGALETGGGASAVPLALQGKAKLVVSLGVFGIEVDHFLKATDSTIKVPLARTGKALFVTGNAQVVLGLAVIRVELERPFKRANGAIRVSHGLQGQTQFEVRLGVVWIELNRLAEARDRPADLAFLQRQAQLEMNLRIRGVEGKRFV
jgi:hypothetical protein